MRTIKLAALIGKSFDRMIDILFRPFSTKKWLKLLFIAFMAGALAGGSGPGGGGGNNRTQDDQKRPAAQSSVSQDKTPAQPSSAPGAETTTAKKPAIILIAAIIFTIILFIIVFFILLTWINSRFRFVWLNAVLNNTTSITEPYLRHAREANSLFKFSLFLTLVFLVFLGLLAAGVLLLMNLNGVFRPGFMWTLPVGLKIFLPPAILLAIIFISILVFSYAVDNFVVPIMAFEGSKIIPALRKFTGIFRANAKDILLFTVVFFLLSIAGAGVQMALIIVLIIVLLLAGLVVFGVPFLIIGYMMKAKILFAIYAVTAGIPFLLIAIIMMMATALPIAVFFMLFSVNYLVSLDCGYTQQTLEQYSLKRTEKKSSAAPIILSVFVLFMIGFVFVTGLLAAIAVPNFMKARQDALEKQKSPVVQGVSK